jgi:predicted enzyme related to lactoylglutathione lyase
MAEYKKVTGIGGIFFKTKNTAKIREWYSTHLGLKTNEYGSLFEFRSADEPAQKGYLQWSPFSDTTKYFEPSQKEFMINYRVADLTRLIGELRENGVQIVGEIESSDYGKFAHIMDPDGNKIELWEPVDSD